MAAAPVDDSGAAEELGGAKRRFLDYVPSLGESDGIAHVDGGDVLAGSFAGRTEKREARVVKLDKIREKCSVRVVVVVTTSKEVNFHSSSS